VGQGLLIHKVPRSHTTTHQSVRLPWTSDQLVAEASTWQHTQNSQHIDIHEPGGIFFKCIVYWTFCLVTVYMCCLDVFLSDWCLGVCCSGFPLMTLLMRSLGFFSLALGGMSVLLGWCFRQWLGVFFLYLPWRTFTAHRGICVLCVVGVFDGMLSNLLFARSPCSRELRGVSLFVSCTQPGVLVPVCLQRVSELARSDRTVALSISPVHVKQSLYSCSRPVPNYRAFSTIGDSVWQWVEFSAVSAAVCVSQAYCC